MTAHTPLETVGQQAKTAAQTLPDDPRRIDAALLAMADALEANAAFLLAENARDTTNATQAGMQPQMLDRLALSAERITQMALGLRQVAELPSPLGNVLHTTTRPNGLVVEKISAPLGVIGIIYEARPNVTADAAALCLKAGNAVILRGGKEAIFSNMAIAHVLAQAAEGAGLPRHSIQLVTDTTRESATALMRLNQYLDVIIPRGGAGLIRAVLENATVPAIETGTGNCHVYVDKAADLGMAGRIAFNAKTSRPSVCNAAEKLLVHRAVAAAFLPQMLPQLAAAGVEIRGEADVAALFPGTVPIAENDWGLEYLGLTLGVKIVDGLAQAIAHINQYSSKHSEAIVTADEARAATFLAKVDSAAVYVNASTRFTDGFEFGLGAEIGISTQKVHARGPMGVSALTSAKFIIKGTGQIR